MQSFTRGTAPVLNTAGRLLEQFSFEKRLGLLFGVVMPVVSALCFPTYVQMMPLRWMERARLLEVPFVLSEFAVIGWAYQRGFDRDRLFNSVPHDLKRALLTLLAAMFVSSALIAPHPSDALMQSLIVVVHLYFAAAVFYLAGTYPHGTLDDLIKPLAAGLVVLAVYIAWWFGFPPDPATLAEPISWNFAVPGFISTRYLGTWCGAIAAALVIQILYREPRARVGVYHLLYVLAFAMAIWSGTRAAILGIGATFLVFVVSKGFPRGRALTTVSLLTLLAIGLAVLFRFHDPAFQIFATEDTGSVNAFAAGRSELWSATIDRWLESPLLGWGTGSTLYVVDVGWSHTQPHNAFLQFLISWGIVGTLACCWLLGRAIRAAHVIAMAHRTEWPLLGMVYALLAMSMVDGALYYPRFVIMIVGSLALILGRAGSRSPANAEERQPAKEAALAG